MRKIDCQDGGHGGHLRFPIGTILIFLICKSPQCFLPGFKSIGYLVQEKNRKIDFQDSRHGFPIGTILTIFDLQFTAMLLAKFQVNLLLVQEKKRKTDLQSE